MARAQGRQGPGRVRDRRVLLEGRDRRAPENEARGNLHVGGRAQKTELTARDRTIIQQVAPMLESYGQILVGLDVIGGYLTEINITSPTGIRHIESLENRNVAAPVIDCLERKAAAVR